MVEKYYRITFLVRGVHENLGFITENLELTPRGVRSERWSHVKNYTEGERISDSLSKMFTGK